VFLSFLTFGSVEMYLTYLLTSIWSSFCQGIKEQRFAIYQNFSTSKKNLSCHLTRVITTISCVPFCQEKKKKKKTKQEEFLAMLKTKITHRPVLILSHLTAVENS